MGQDNTARALTRADVDPRAEGAPAPFPLTHPLSSFRYFNRQLLNILALGLGDFVALSIGLVGGGLLRMWLKGEPMISAWSWTLLLAWFAGSLAVGLLPGWGLGAVEELRRSVLLMLGVFAMAATAIFLGKASATVSRLTFAMSFALALPLLLLLRLQIKRMLIRLQMWGLPAVVYGATETGRLAIRALREERGLGYVPVGIFEDDLAPGQTVENVPVLGNLLESTQLAPAAILAMPDTPRHKIVELLEGPLSGYRKVVIIPDLLEAPSLWVRARDMGGIVGLEVTSNLLNPLARYSKRAVDFIATLFLSPLWIPLCGLVAAAIWLEDRHSPLFRQERSGGNGHLFQAYKFRTMLPRAESVLRERLEADEALRKEWNTHFKLRNDPRVTRVGAILRRTSLDELPQLFNVLAGSMSLVGPRPLPAYHYADLPERVRRIRERVRPGVTGLWQVSGRSDTGTAGMLRWDSYYVRNWSVWLDIVILVRTVRAVLRGNGAY